jgi:hypothetical protein
MASEERAFRLCHLCYEVEVRTDVGRLLCDGCEERTALLPPKDRAAANRYLDAFATEWRKRFG